MNMIELEIVGMIRFILPLLGVLILERADETIPQIPILQIYCCSDYGAADVLACTGLLGTTGLNDIAFESIKSCTLCLKILQFSIECPRVPE